MRLRLLRQLLLRRVELVAHLQPLLGRERAAELALEADDLRAELQDLALQHVRLALQVFDPHALRLDFAELAEPDDGVLDLGHGNAEDEGCVPCLPGVFMSTDAT